MKWKAEDAEDIELDKRYSEEGLLCTYGTNILYQNNAKPGGIIAKTSKASDLFSMDSSESLKNVGK